MRDLTEEMLAGLVADLFGTTTLERHGATLSFARPFASKDYHTLVRETAGLDLAHATEAELQAALERKDVADADALSGAKLVDEVFKNFVEPTLVQPTFVLDYPVALSPLAKLKRGDATRVERWELFIQKREIANAFSELNDPEEQRRRSSRLLSLITVIAVGGVTVGVMALVVVLGVMNGLQADLRDKILVANPHLRVLTYGEGLRLDDWRRVLERVRRTPGVEAAAPFVLTQAGISAGHDYAEGVVVLGVEVDTGRRAVTSFAQHFTKGDLRFRTTRPDVEGGIALGARLASKLSAYSGDVVNLVAFSGTKFNPSLGAYVPQFHRYEVTGLFDTGMYEYDNSYVALDRRVAQRFAGLDTAVTGIEVRLADPWQARAFALQLESQLVYPYRALDWQTQNQSLFSALKLEKLAMAFVVSFSSFNAE